MKLKVALLILLSFVLFLKASAVQAEAKHTQVALLAKTSKKALPVRRLPISERTAFIPPNHLISCPVFSAIDLLKLFDQAAHDGSCEWIMIRPNSDLDPDKPLWIEYDRPLIIEKRYKGVQKPLVISNETGRSVVFKLPRTGGCSLILRRTDFALMGFTLEGALCQEAAAATQ